MNNNSNNENAILGVFSSAGYIDVGTKVRGAKSRPRRLARPRSA